MLLSLKDLQNCKNCNLPAVCRLYFPNNRVADKAYCKLLPLFFYWPSKTYGGIIVSFRAMTLRANSSTETSEFMTITLGEGGKNVEFP